MPVAPTAGRPVRQQAATRLPAGFRWIAVRPGPPPPARRRRRPLSPTPRYQTIPRWGLADQIAPPAAGDGPGAKKNASAAAVRIALIVAAVVFAVAAMTHILRYLLLLINRTVLLPPWVATPALLVGALASLAAMAAVIATGVILTSWLIGRRAEVFEHVGQPDPRPEWSLWAGCLIPVVNLVWAPVFVLELAHAERIAARQRRPITAWWLAWVVSTAITGWAIWTGSATEPQAVADNTVTMIIAYLAGLTVLFLLWRVFDGFISKPVARPRHRWVVVADDGSGVSTPTVADELENGSASGEQVVESDEFAAMVESEDREPAA